MRQTPSFIANFAILRLLKETARLCLPLLTANFPHEETERIEAWLRGGSCRCIMDAMQEVLSKTVDPKAPLEGQEFYELRIDDSDDIWRPGFIVVEAHAV